LSEVVTSTHKELRMRSNRLMVVLVAVALAGCGDDIAANPDQSPSPDLTMTTPPPDLAMPVDLTIPFDMVNFVSATQFNTDLATAVCQHLLMCGQLLAANMNACIEEERATLSIDLDDEINHGRIMLNELQCINAVTNARCDNSDLGKVFAHLCSDSIYQPG